MRNSFRLTILVLLATVSVSIASLLYGSTEPTASWVYSYLDELFLRVGQGKLFAGTCPYTRHEIANYLRQVDPKQLDRKSVWFYRRLSEEFGIELYEQYCNSPVAAYSFGAKAESNSPVRISSLLGIDTNTWGVVNAWGLLRASINWTEAHKINTKPWKDVARCGLDAGGIVIACKGIEFFFGRDEVSWGGDFRKGLLVSGQAPSFDMAKLKWSSQRFCYTWFGSKLRREHTGSGKTEIQRYLSSHRIEFILKDWLDVGFSECVIYSGEGRGFELGYLNPVTILYAEQWNLENDDNILASFDFCLAVKGKARIRGEILVDDFQYKSEGEPNKLGGLLTVKALNPILPGLSSIAFSYVKIQPGVYGHRKESNRFIHEGIVIGYPGGSDVSAFSFSADLWYPENFIWEAELGFTRKGYESSPGVNGNEKRIDAGLAVRWHRSSGLSLEAQANWNRIENFSGFRDRCAEDLKFSLSVNLWGRNLLNLE